MSRPVPISHGRRRASSPRNAIPGKRLVRTASSVSASTTALFDRRVLLDCRVMNPRLHLMIHEIVATQIIDGDPPEMFETAERLIAAGRDRHAVLHMLGSTASEQIWSASHDRRLYDRTTHIAALAALPGSWDQMAHAARDRPPRGSGRRRSP